MHDAMAFWRSANCAVALVLADRANDAWHVPCLRRYYYYSCAWRARGGAHDEIDCHHDNVWSRLTCGAAVGVPMHCDDC